MRKVTMLIFLLCYFACSPQGTTETILDGDSLTNLPPALKGLKVYNVSLGEGTSIKVAVLGNNLNSIQYKSGKYSKDVLLFTDSWSGNKREIPIKKIIMENDSVIMAVKEQETP